MLQPKGQKGKEKKNCGCKGGFALQILPRHLSRLITPNQQKKKRFNLGADSRHLESEAVAFDCNKEARSLEMKWGSFKRDVSKFHEIYQNVKDLDKNGYSETFVSFWLYIN